MNPICHTDSPAQTLEFFAHVRSLGARHDPSMHFLGMTRDSGRAFVRLVSTVRASAWNMQRVMTFHTVRDNKNHTEDLRRRGVPMRMVVNPASLGFCPILSSYDRSLRVGPVLGPLMIMDSSLVVVTGTDGDSIWTSSDPKLVDFGIRASEARWAVADPAVPEGQEPLLTPRMLTMAWLLADGASDRQISRELGISERTVFAEVREIGRRLGGANRAHTIARICGAPL